MINKMLVANRGEIALRIIRACKELGITSVAVYSEADANSLHVRFADEDVCIGPASPSESYLDARRVIAAAEVTNADAIHPGYGFWRKMPILPRYVNPVILPLSARRPKVIQLLGDKSLAKQTMKDAGVPIIPGSDGVVDDYHMALEVIRRFDYPVIKRLPPAGGGRGMRLVTKPEELRQSF